MNVKKVSLRGYYLRAKLFGLMMMSILLFNLLYFLSHFLQAQ